MDDEPEILFTDDDDQENDKKEIQVGCEPNTSNSKSISIGNAIEPVMPYTKFIPWKEATDKPLPCIIDLERDPDWYALNFFIIKQPSDDGLLFVKIEKAASSTVGSVATRISHALAHRVDANVTRPDGLKVKKFANHDFRTCGQREPTI